MENTHLPPLKFSAIFSSSLAVAKKKFFPALGLLLFVAIVNSAANEFTYGLGTILLFPLTIGIMLFFLRSVRGEAAPMSSVFEPFKQYFRMLWGYLRVLLFTLLWALPGIALSAGAFLWIGADATRHEYSNLQLLKLLPPVILLAVTLP